jgi:hypothetical protein
MINISDEICNDEKISKTNNLLLTKSILFENKYLPSIWKSNQNGNKDLLFFNYIEKEKVEIVLPKYINESSVQFRNLNNKIGSLVMTPIGIARLISIEHEYSRVFFSKNKIEKSFQNSSVTAEFKLYINNFVENTSVSYLINLPSQGTVSDIRRVINTLNIVNNKEIDYQLYYKTNEIFDEESFEELSIKEGDKLFLINCKKLENKISRFTLIDEYWGCSED